MGIPKEVLTSDVSVTEGSSLARSSEALSYVTDLLGELQTIANLSGLSEMASDLNILILKHMASSSKI